MPTWPICDCAEGDCLENNTSDFDLMRLCPNQLLYFWMQFIMVMGLLLVALENRTMSLAYITWVMGGAPMLALTLSIF